MLEEAYLPLSQALHLCSVASVWPWYLPISHAWHELAVAVGAYLPFMQTLHLCSVAAFWPWYLPDSHDRQMFPLLYAPLLHDAHAAVLCVGQAVPLAAVPPEHVQTLFLHTRLLMVLGAVDSY